MKFEKIKPGMTLYDVGSHGMGNTTIRTMSVWPVVVVSVDADSRSMMASWNGNKPRRYYEHAIKKLREKKPLMISTWGGAGSRLATREEIKAHKEAQRSK